MSFSANAAAASMGASMAMSILQSPYAVVKNIQGNLTSPSPEEINAGVIPELFLTTYTPGFEPYRIQAGVEPVFTIVRQEVEHLAKGTTDIEIRNRYISVEEQPVRLEQTLATSADGVVDPGAAASGAEITGRIYSIVYTASEKELVSYASGIELQVSINEESNSSQTSYINSVASKELEYNALSVLGSTMAEQVDVAQQNIQSSRELAPAAPETITDTGGTY